MSLQEPPDSDRIEQLIAERIARGISLLEALFDLLQAAVVTPIASTRDGPIVEAVAIPWNKLVSTIEKDPSLVYCLDWRKWEEIVAAGYHRRGYEVVLTPRSGDRGRDIIATHRGFVTVRIFDQIKAFSPGHLVTAHDVRAMLGVLATEPNVSKGFITTTSDFAPGIFNDLALRQFMPFRLELRARDALLAWLLEARTLEDCSLMKAQAH